MVLIELGSPVAFHKSVCVHQERTAAGLNVSHSYTRSQVCAGCENTIGALDGVLITVGLFTGAAAVCGLFGSNRLISSVHLIASVPAFKTPASHLHFNGNALCTKKKKSINQKPVLQSSEESCSALGLFDFTMWLLLEVCTS